MKAKKITESELSLMRISSLPNRPTAPISMGGRGYSAEEMKAAFDRLPLLIAERFNSLIEDIEALGEGSLADAIKTGLSEGHSLTTLFSEIKGGAVADRLTTAYGSLNEALAKINERLCRLEGGSNEQADSTAV